MKFRRLVLLIAVLLGVGAAFNLTTHLTQAKAASGTVTTCDDAHLATALSGGGLVTFNCGPATLTVTSLKTISADTTIDGSNNGQPFTLTAASSVQLFTINAGIGLTLTHLTIANLNSGFQFPIYNNGGRVNVFDSHFYNNLTGVFQSYGPMTVTQSVFTGTAAMEAIYMGSGVPLQVSNSQFISNTYGAISSQGPVVIDNSQFDDNLRPVNNGAVYMRSSVGIGGGPLTVTSSSFVGNTGGAIVSYGGSILISSTNFFSNIIGFAGSGLFFQSSSITDVVQIINSTFEGNHGGALSTNSGNATFKIVNSRFINNLGGDSAVDIPYMIGATILDSSFVGNVTPNNNWPGALLLSTPAWISGTSFINNSGPQGGAFYMSGGGKSVYITNTQFISNTSQTYDGGAIRANSGDLIISGVTVQGNRTLASGAYGGGIYANDPFSVVKIDHSLIDNNTASSTGYGGGLALYGPSVIVNSTIYSNAAYYGGGIYAARDLTLTNVTVMSNTAFGINAGGNLRDSSLTPGVMVNTILAGGSPENCSGNPASLGYNLSDDASCGLTITHDLSNMNPLLGPFQNNGGPTYSFMPTASSPAVNGGSNAYCPTDDQRGVARPLVSVCDIGAIESSYKLPQTITFAALPDRKYGDPPFVVTATASSGLTVTFTAGGPCTATGPNGHTITLLDGGICTITAHQVGDATTAAAADVPRSFMIVKHAIYLPMLMRNY